MGLPIKDIFLGDGWKQDKIYICQEFVVLRTDDNAILIKGDYSLASERSPWQNECQFCRNILYYKINLSFKLHAINYRIKCILQIGSCVQTRNFWNLAEIDSIM